MPAAVTLFCGLKLGYSSAKALKATVLPGVCLDSPPFKIVGAGRLRAAAFLLDCHSNSNVDGCSTPPRHSIRPSHFRPLPHRNHGLRHSSEGAHADETTHESVDGSHDLCCCRSSSMACCRRARNSDLRPRVERP